MEKPGLPRPQIVTGMLVPTSTGMYRTLACGEWERMDSRTKYHGKQSFNVCRCLFGNSLPTRLYFDEWAKYPFHMGIHSAIEDELRRRTLPAEKRDFFSFHFFLSCSAKSAAPSESWRLPSDVTNRLSRSEWRSESGAVPPFIVVVYQYFPGLNILLLHCYPGGWTLTRARPCSPENDGIKYGERRVPHGDARL